MSAYIQTNHQARVGVVIFILVIHALFGWMLVTGLAKSVVEKVFEPLVTDIVEEDVKEDKPPPPPPPEMERPPVEVPPPEVAIDMPTEVTETTALSNVTDKPQPPPPPAPVVVAKPTPAKIRTPADPDQFYPAASARAEEQGSAVVEACVDPKGKLLREPTVRTTSGFARLDEAAVKVARATRYTAGQQNGQPMDESCIAFRVKFQLKN
jgi:periplasmic protein TonB